MSLIPRIGVVGGGVYGTAMLKCFAGAARRHQIELVALADVSHEILNRHRSAFNIDTYRDYREMFHHARLDAVAVATPDHLHCEVVLAAAEAGLHILAQKPLDTDITRAQRMIDTCREHNVMLFVDFHKRFDPAHLRLKQDITAGKLGAIQYGYVCMEDKIEVPSQWLHKWAAKSSPSWFIGVHFYDLVWWLMESEPVSVFAHGHKGKLTSMGIDTWDSICSTVKFTNGSTFSFDISWILPNSFPSIVNQQIRVVGQEGVSEVDSQDRGMFSAYSSSSESLVINAFGAQEYEHPLWKTQMQGYTFSSMYYFLDLITLLVREESSLDSLKGKYPDGNSALISTRIGEAIDRSIVEGNVVTL